jgi:hypothetical protein
MSAFLPASASVCFLARDLFARKVAELRESLALGDSVRELVVQLRQGLRFDRFDCDGVVNDLTRHSFHRKV